MNVGQAIAFQILQSVFVVLAAPLLVGWVNQCRAWLQNKSAPPLLTPYRVLLKLFIKEPVLAHNASSLFRVTPYILFGCMCLAAAIVPTLSGNLPFNTAADAIALVGLFALARVFLSLAAMDIGTAFGTLGARREMMIAAMQGALAFQKGLGAVHALSHPLGAYRNLKLHHGTLNSILLPPVIRFTESAGFSGDCLSRWIGCLWRYEKL